MVAESHSAIQSAIYEALIDTTYKRVLFQAIESDFQKVLRATELELGAGGKLDPNTKYKQIVLLTPRTTAPDPIDPQQ